MTLLKIDLSSVTKSTHPDDAVALWSPVHRGSLAGAVITTAPTRTTLTAGKADVEVEPGPLMVHIQARGMADHGPKQVVVPDTSSVSLLDLFEQFFTYEQPVIGRVAQLRDEAERAADRAEDGAATVGDAQTVLTARDDAVTAAEDAEQIATTLPATIQSELGTRVPPAVSDAIAADGTVTAAAATAAAAAVDAYAGDTIKRGTGEAQLTSASVIADLPPGRYQCSQTTFATALGLPEGQRGTLLVDWVDAGGVYRRQKYEFGNAGERKVYRNTYWNGSWTGWKLEFDATQKATPYLRGAIPSGVTPDTMMGSDYNGVWTFPSGYAATWGVPSNAASFLEVWSSGLSTLQELKTMTTPVQQYRRRGYNGVWSYAWERIGGGSAPAPGQVEADEYATATSKNALNVLVPSAVDPTLTYEADHATLVADLKTRIGTVTTGGKAAVALVADHGTTAFKEWVWAAAKARGIPFTMALCPEIHLDGKGDSRHQATNDDIKGWVSEGLAIASHSGDHDGATGYFDVARQIVTSKKKLEEKLGTTVDSWVQPGYVLANGSYDGFGTGQSASRYTDYYAGRLLQQTYPVITGYAGDDFVYPGDADLPVGVRRSLVERKDAYQGVMDHIQQAIDTGGKHVNFLHPYAIPEASDTYVTRTEYLAFLDWLVQKRDAGDLVLLTLPELAIARPTHTP